MSNKFVARKGLIALQDSEITGSLSVTGITSGSFIGDGSGLTGVISAQTSSYVDFSNIDNKPTLISGSSQIASDISGSFTSISASIASDLVTNYLRNTTDTLVGDLTVTGKLTAQEYHTELVSASIIYESGSTQFGNSSDDTHVFTGSIDLDGTLNINTPSISGREEILTAKVSDGGNSLMSIGNGTSTGGQFISTLNGYQDLGRQAFIFNGLGNSTYDLSTSDPMMIFTVSNTNSSSDPVNGVRTAITTRDVFKFSTTGYDYLTIKANGDSIFGSSGNVGIGTSSPVYNLDVAGEIGIDSYLRHNGDTDTFFGFSGADTIKFRTAGTDRLTIDSSGNLILDPNGIGAAYLKLNTSSGPTGDGHILLQRGGSNKFQIAADVSDGLTFYNYTAGGTSMRIDSSGNVGIGTTSPGQKLHVEGNSLFNGGNGASTFNDVNIGGVSGWSNGEAHRINFIYGTASSPNNFTTIESQFDGTDGRLRFRNIYNGGDSTAIAMTILGGGNVGIGTDSPSTKLQVVGSTAGATVLDVQGTSGQLFSVTDDLTGEIFAVSDISGIPILSVDASGIVYVDNKIAVGDNQTVSGNASSVTGGACNTASGNCSTVGGGLSNTASGTNSSVGGGFYNRSTQGYTTIGGGCNNLASCNYTTVGGGTSNTASNFFSTIGGGFLNTASGNRSTVSGGYYNTASGNYSTVAGGGGYVGKTDLRNRATAKGATVGGGQGNLASGAYSTVAGGFINTASGNSATVIGGRGNTASCYCSVAANLNQTTSASCQFRVQALSKASGTFRINHPDPSKSCTHYLAHSFVESPTAGDNIYRYKVNVTNGQAVIQLPSYYKFLNENDQVWITPQGHFGIGYGNVNEEQTELTITANTDGEYNVLLIGTRKDFDAVHHWQGTETYK